LDKKTNISQLIRKIRKRTGLTQEKFAAKLGVTFPTINRWENSHVKPSPLAMNQIEAFVRNLGDAGKDLVDEFFPSENTKG